MKSLFDYIIQNWANIIIYVLAGLIMLEFYTLLRNVNKFFKGGQMNVVVEKPKKRK